MSEPSRFSTSQHLEKSPSGRPVDQGDIVGEAISALAAVLRCEGVRVEAKHLQAAEDIVRTAWGGSRVYVAKTGNADSDRRVSRDREIAQAFFSGVGTPEIAARYGLTTRRIKQILAELGLNRSAESAEMTCIEHFPLNHYHPARSTVVNNSPRMPLSKPVTLRSGASREETI